MPQLDPRLRRILVRLVRYLRACVPNGDTRRFWLIRRALTTGIFVQWYYEAQTGRTFPSERHALGHYLTVGARTGMLPNPLIDVALAHDRDRAEALATDMGKGTVPSHRFSSAFDWEEYVRVCPAAKDHQGGVVGHHASTSSLQAGAPALRDLRGEDVDWPTICARLRRQRRISERVETSTLFDRKYYEAQCGVTFLSRRAALWHYLTVGEPAALAPNPLFEPDWYAEHRKSSSSYILNEYLLRNMLTVSPHPHLDPEAWVERHPESASHPGGPIGHFLATAGATTVTMPFGDLAPMRNWHVLQAEMYARARAHVAQDQVAGWGGPRAWATSKATKSNRELDRLAATTTDSPPHVTVVFDLNGANDSLAENVQAMLGQDHPAVELIAIAAPNDRRFHDLDERVRVIEPDSTSYATRVNRVVSASASDYVLIWRSRDKPTKHFIRRSLAALRAAPTTFVYSAIQQAGTLDPAVHGEPFSRDGFVWGDHRSVSRTALMSRELFLRAGGLDDETVGSHGYDLTMRASALVEPVFVPQIGMVADLRRESAPRREKTSRSKKIPREAPSREHIVRARAECDWQSTGERVAGRVSLLMPVFEDWSLTLDAVHSALATTSGRDVEVVLLDNGSRHAVGAMIAAAFGHQPRVIYRRVPRNTNFAMGSNLAFLWSTGDRVIFMNNDTEPEGDWLDPLLAALDDDTVRGSQPLLLYPDRTVQAAGTVFLGGTALPWHFLAGHPREDAEAAQQTEFSALTAAFLACRASEVQLMRGFDPVYANGMEDVDLCLRLLGELGGSFRVVLDSVVVHKESQSLGRMDHASDNRAVFVHRWTRRLPAGDLPKYETAGFRASYHPTKVHASELFRTGQVMLERPSRRVSVGPAAGLPALRWAIKSAAVSGRSGDLWGDTFFAEALARSLRALGQEVVIDRADAHRRPRSENLDDVIVGLRGLTHVTPQPGATSVLWIISHPEAVSEPELAGGFDLVYAASIPWAATASELSGREVRPLLQATDTKRFHPGPVDPALASDALFVGRTRRVFRPIVRDAVEIGSDLTIFGDGWEDFIDASHVRADHLDNQDLPAAYRSARIVLNDHWTDMAAYGFLSNRLFDAAAIGARVVTDKVAGLEGVFGDLVQQYETLDELRVLLDPSGSAWVTDEERLAQAAAVRAEHSFDARALVLLSDVLDERGIAHDLPRSAGRPEGSGVA